MNLYLIKCAHFIYCLINFEQGAPLAVSAVQWQWRIKAVCWLPAWLRKLSLRKLHVFLCGYMHWFLGRLVLSAGILGVIITGGCEPLNVGVGN